MVHTLIVTKFPPSMLLLLSRVLLHIQFWHVTLDVSNNGLIVCSSHLFLLVYHIKCGCSFFLHGSLHAYPYCFYDRSWSLFFILLPLERHQSSPSVSIEFSPCCHQLPSLLSPGCSRTKYSRKVMRTMNQSMSQAITMSQTQALNITP